MCTMSSPTLVRPILGGLITVGFSDRRARKKNLIRQFTSCDTGIKNTSNPEWMRLPRMCRLTHDELERWAGRNVTSARISGAKRFNRADWHSVGGTERIWVDRLVAAGWAEWDGQDLILLGVDLDGERGFVARMAEKKLAGRDARVGREICPPHAELVKIAPCQTAETSHFEDTAPAPALTDQRSSGSGSGSPPPAKAVPPPPFPERGGGGGTPHGWGGKAEPEGFGPWFELYGKDAGRPDAAATWADLRMSAGEVRALGDFTRRALRHRANTRDDGAWKCKPAKFLGSVWKRELDKARKKRAEATNGHAGPETTEDLAADLMATMHKRWGDA